MNLRQIALVGLAALALGGTAAAQVAPARVGQAAQVTPPPPPAPNSANAPTPGTLIGTPVPSTPAALASPSPSPAPGGRRGRRPAASPSPEAGASESPEPPQFSTMDGVWEVQIQPLNGARVIYSHLYVSQKGDALSGTWVRTDKDKVPFTGTFDGRLFKLTATAADAAKTTWTLSGYAENFSDMVGLLVATADKNDRGTPFTASHRKKERIGF